VHAADNADISFVSQFYGSESNDSKKVARRNFIVRKVAQEIELRRERRTAEDGSFFLGRERARDEEGVFHVPSGEFFNDPKIVVWRKVGMVAYTLILELDENRALASQLLGALPRIFSDLTKKPSSTGYEFFNRPEEALILINSFLPNGQLLFITPNLAKHLRKEVDYNLAKT